MNSIVLTQSPVETPVPPSHRRLHGFLLMALMLVTSIVAQAFQTVSDGKYYSISGSPYYVKSSMNNLYVDDGTNTGSTLDGAHWYRRSGESIVLEKVPSVGFLTGSYWSGGSYYTTYKVWTDGGTGYTWGKFLALQWNDSASFTQIWGNALTINLQASNSQYVQCENGGNSWVGANHSSAYTYEELTMWLTAGGTVKDGDEIVLGSWNYLKFLTAENGGGGDVDANRDNAGSWERFTIHKISSGDQYIRSGDQVSISTSGGYYLTALGGGGSYLKASASSAGSYETFTLTYTTAISR